MPKILFIITPCMFFRLQLIYMDDVNTGDTPRSFILGTRSHRMLGAIYIVIETRNFSNTDPNYPKKLSPVSNVNLINYKV